MAITSPNPVQDTPSGTANPTKKTGNLILAGATALGPTASHAHDILVCSQGVSLWGGVDPQTGRIIDAHHPQHGADLAGRIVMMPTSRGSCSGSSVLLQLALNGAAPAALVFHQQEDILTLGALVAAHIFETAIPVFSLNQTDYQALTHAGSACLARDAIVTDEVQISIDPLPLDRLVLTDRDLQIRNGAEGRAMAMAMDIICRIAAVQGAHSLRDVTRGHIDGCILAHPANLVFAEKMAALGARTSIPTTTNAISVDQCSWQQQGIDKDFGHAASALATLYTEMGAAPTFTCAPYLLESPPAAGESIGWSESNAVIYANTVLGARSMKLPDFLDLFVAMTGRAPLAGVYTDEGRRPARIIDVSLPRQAHDDSIWPLVGWLVGSLSPDRIPLVRGLEATRLTDDDLKGFCAAFGTTSGMPLLHIAGHTPEATLPPLDDADIMQIDQTALAQAWRTLNADVTEIDLVAIGSPHASLTELQQIASLMGGRSCHARIDFVATVGRDVMAAAASDGTGEQLAQAGIRIIPDVCWCSITEPLFPPAARVLMTNSGKYAHYADGLCGRKVRFGSLRDCVEAAVTGAAKSHPPQWAQEVAPGNEATNG